MNKTISMSIRVSEEELDKLKQAARIEASESLIFTGLEIPRDYNTLKED